MGPLKGVLGSLAGVLYVLLFPVLMLCALVLAVGRGLGGLVRGHGAQPGGDEHATGHGTHGR